MTELLAWFIPIAILSVGMSFSMGCNDESMGSIYGARSLPMNYALLLGALTEVAGSVLFGTEVTTTIQGKLFSLSVFGTDIDSVMVLALSSLIGATTWLVGSSLLGLPTSSTHSIVGAVVVAAMAARGVSIVNWDQVGYIVLSWFISPVLGTAVVAVLYTVLQVTLLWRRKSAYRRTKLAIPVIVFLCLSTLGLFVALRGLSLPSDVPKWKVAVIVLGISAGLGILSLGAVPLIEWRVREGKDTRVFPATFTDPECERLFAYVQILSASLFSFARGSNDAANGAGPFALALGIYRNGASALRTKQQSVDLWVLAIGGVVMGVGLFIVGRRVVRAVGDTLTELTPTGGVMVEMSTAVVVLGFSALGVPVSSTHVMVGAVYGMGKYRSLVIERYFTEAIPARTEPTEPTGPTGPDTAAVEMVTAGGSETPSDESDAKRAWWQIATAFVRRHHVVFSIIAAWILTIPIAGAVSALFYVLLHLAL